MGASHRHRPPQQVRLYGRHAVTAALANPRRQMVRLHATGDALADLRRGGVLPEGLPVETADRRALDRLLPPGAVYQGLVLEARPLPACALDICAPVPEEPANVVVLDQVEDPHNVGAVMRSAAAFGARALVTQDRHSPPESGALAKAASGALDVLPWVRVPNLARALARLADMGYWRIGLSGDGPEVFDDIDPGERVVLVLGAEGRGLRPLVARHCDLVARIPMCPASPLIDSLNVSAAAAIALHRFRRRRG